MTRGAGGHWGHCPVFLRVIFCIWAGMRLPEPPRRPYKAVAGILPMDPAVVLLDLDPELGEGGLDSEALGPPGLAPSCQLP